MPAHREVILASGVAELACAAGLLHPRTARLAGWASAALLVASSRRTSRWPPTRQDRQHPAQARALARLPLQLPLIRSALKAARAGSLWITLCGAGDSLPSD